MQRPGRRLGSLGPAETEPPRLLGESGHDVVEDRPLHINPLGAQTHLAGVREDRPGQSGDRQVEVGIGADNGGVLPPSSNETGRTRGATVAMMRAPVADEPVKVTPSMPGCPTSVLADVTEPVHDVVHPRGSPASASTSANSAAVDGVFSLEADARPRCRRPSAGATFQVSSRSGRFQGTITATTPSGLRTA